MPDSRAPLGGTLAASGTFGTMDVGGGGDEGLEKTSRHASHREHKVRFLRSKNEEMNLELTTVEQERDEALYELSRWDEKRLEIQQHYEHLKHEHMAAKQASDQSALTIQNLDEQIRTLSAQNRQLLDAVDEEEREAKEKAQNAEKLEKTFEELQKVKEEYDKIKETGQQALAKAMTEIAKYDEELRNAMNETEQLREAEENFAAQAQADIAVLEEKLKEAKDKAVEYVQTIQHNEVYEHKLNESLQQLKETLEELSMQKKGIRAQLELDVSSKDNWTMSKAEIERRKDNLEKTVDTYRQALRAAEEQNARMLDENKSGADNFRQLGDKVYALMDQLRQHQTDLQKSEAFGQDREKKIIEYDRQVKDLSEQLQNEVDAKLAAEAEARNSAQVQALLLKKNKMLEEAHQMAIKAQEKVQKRLQELTDKMNALNMQNEYLATRIDGNEEDKGALKYELRRLEDETRQAQAKNAQLLQERASTEDKFNNLDAETAAVKAELDYIKREDMLDESGRTKPILIESDSPIMERLQINEFLYSAQQTRNPVPMLVEKVSHVLELLHTAQTQSDVYLQDLQRSNTMLTALRQKNMALYEKVQMCESWKLRALMKIASNAFEVRQSVQGHRVAKVHEVLYLDGLQYSYKELEQLRKLIDNYNKAEFVKEIRLRDNALQTMSVQPLTNLIEQCPYLSRVDLRGNKLDFAAQDALKAFVEHIPGITSVTKDPVTGDIKAKSGNQVRLVLNLEDQGPPDPASPTSAAAAALGATNPQGAAADTFLASAAGLSSQHKPVHANDALGVSGPRTVQVPQRGGVPYPTNAARPGSGLGQSPSDTALPRITPTARGGLG